MAQDVAVVGIPMTAQVNAGADAGAGAADNAVASGGAGGAGGATVPEPPAKPKPRSPSHCLWAALIARIYEVFPLQTGDCAWGCSMRPVFRCILGLMRLEFLSLTISLVMGLVTRI